MRLSWSQHLIAARTLELSGREQTGTCLALMGMGGLLVGAIGPTSVLRSLTGRGWTWKGRSLAQP